MFKRIFLTGLAAIIPVVLTGYVIIGLFMFADGILGNLINSLLEKYVGSTIPGLGIVLSILIILIVGLIFRLSRLRLLKWFEAMFMKIPLVNKIYLPIKKVVDFMLYPPQQTFRQPVLIEYPRRGVYSMGFLTNKSSAYFKERVEKKLYNVFIPSSPSPLTGFTVMVSEEDLIFLNIKVDEALKLIVSGGLLNPNE